MVKIFYLISFIFLAIFLHFLFLYLKFEGVFHYYISSFLMFCGLLIYLKNKNKVNSTKYFSTIIPIVTMALFNLGNIFFIKQFEFSFIVVNYLIFLGSLYIIYFGKKIMG